MQADYSHIFKVCFMKYTCQSFNLYALITLHPAIYSLITASGSPQVGRLVALKFLLIELVFIYQCANLQSA